MRAECGLLQCADNDISMLEWESVITQKNQEKEDHRLCADLLATDRPMYGNVQHL